MRILLAILIIQVTCWSLSGQKISFSHVKFHAGDNKHWANYSFNDTKWVLIHPEQTWQQQGLNSGHFGWYRIHFNLTDSFKAVHVYDSLIIDLAQIDDADEIFLNGKLLSKTGQIPEKKKPYSSCWNCPRHFRISAADPRLFYHKENIIAIRVYDGDPPGGMHAGIPFVKKVNLSDNISLKVMQMENHSYIQINNKNEIPVNGTINFTVREFYTDTLQFSFSKNINLSIHSSYAFRLPVALYHRQIISANFRLQDGNQTIDLSAVPPYNLTPPPSPFPRINSPDVFGLRPGSPIQFKIAASGLNPKKYFVKNLPKGLTIDSLTGILSGKLNEPGDYQMLVKVQNEAGIAAQYFTIRCGNSIALTPPMGWNSWNCWGTSVSDAKVRSAADALIEKGLVDHGWSYINIDDGWEAASRAPDGTIISNEKFPDMKALGNYLHTQGLKYGIYSSPGPRTCGNYLGSYRHEAQDAGSYSDWGIDYLKYDWCSYGEIHNNDTALASFKAPYKLMQDELRDQPRDILYSLCQYGMREVWKWAPEVDANCWRTTGDIIDTWNSLFSIGFSQERLSKYASPGRWNDPDMLIVGNVGWGENLHPTHLSPDEQYLHISLWCLLSAPLLIGCDIAAIDLFTNNLLTNDEVLAINQDNAGNQAKALLQTKDIQIWAKKLTNGDYAIGVFNVGNEHLYYTINFDELNLGAKSYNVRDLWRQLDLGQFTKMKARIASHGVLLLRIQGIK